MATPQKCEPSKVIGSISKLAGTLVGTAVITGKRIIGSAKPPSKGLSGKPGKKTIQTPTKRKKKAVRKTEKKKSIKRKPAGSSGKSGALKKKAVRKTKKKKASTSKKKQSAAK